MRYKIKSPDDKGIRIIIIQEITDNIKHPIQILYCHGFKPVYYAAKMMKNTNKDDKSSVSYKRAIKVLEQCELTYPINEFPEHYI